MKLHPIRLSYKRSNNKQTCNLCGSDEQWTTGGTHAENALSEVEQWNTLHLVHLVRNHLTDVQASLTTSARSEAVTLTDEDVRKRVNA